MSQVVTINHDDTFIPGVPAAELQGPGTYEVEGGHVVSFLPFLAPAVDATPVEPLGSDSDNAGDQQVNQITDTQQEAETPAPQSVEAPLGNTLG